MPLNFSSLFPPSREININFDWVDIASGVGYVSYDCHSTLDSVGIKRILVESRNKSGLIGLTGHNSGEGFCLTAATVSVGGAQKALDIDWDNSAFTTPRTLKGTAYFNLYLGADCAADSTAYIIVKVRKWDGATETDLLTIQSSTIGFPSTKDLQVSLSGDIPQTTFKVGEQLRITFEAWAVINVTTTHLYLSGQPADTVENNGSYAIAAAKTRIISAIPYKIDN
jgi:hypothetical protein